MSPSGSAVRFVVARFMGEAGDHGETSGGGNAASAQHGSGGERLGQAKRCPWQMAGGSLNRLTDPPDLGLPNQIDRGDCSIGSFTPRGPRPVAIHRKGKTASRNCANANQPAASAAGH